MAAFWLNVVWMMAGQLYWEKSQGNLELYFAAPMNLMCVLLGMAVGGLIMSSPAGDRGAGGSGRSCSASCSGSSSGSCVALVFVLTLSALYGLGMTLASLFLLWGREAFHLANVLIEPVYFVSGLNFPVGRLGVLGALAIATIPFAVGLDAMRQLVFPGEPYITGTPPPEVEALILVAMTVGVHAARPLDDPAHRADGPVARHAVDPMAVSAIVARRRPARRPGADARFDPAQAEGAASPTPSAACGRRCCSAGGSSPTGPTRRCS